MKVTLDQQPVITATLSMDCFRNEMKKSFDLERAIKDNVVITKDGGVDDKSIKEMIFLNINWGRVIALYNQNKKKTMNIEFFVAHMKDLPKFKPDKWDTKTGEFTFDYGMQDEERLLAAHNFIPLAEHHFETLLADAMFEYGDKSWVPIIYL